MVGRMTRERYFGSLYPLSEAVQSSPLMGEATIGVAACFGAAISVACPVLKPGFGVFPIACPFLRTQPPWNCLAHGSSIGGRPSEVEQERNEDG